ncbi:HD domain-containing protein [Mucilaginibacter flavidus]|uniref:HD domain-containing protein n=1 Tax=Mucilaginibacter flavidus TaxID=2949309 RepID=UPI002092C50E|nr:HD domain-containing protein [Mucilaginibacter flavidus]MCO5948387.1 HD domain-containing protein [Mucilaginibacter flavidus]
MQLDDAGNYIINKLNDELPEYLNYHNSSHTLDVYEAVKRLAQANGIAGDEMTLLLTAAYYHDSGFLVKANGHEVESCRIARETLPNFGYDTNEIDKICGMIMATRLPQSPKNHLEEILADADLDYLGRDDFSFIANQLFLENSFFGTAGDMDAWNRKQVAFMEKHQYFTKTANNLRQAKKDANLGRIKAQVK